MKRLLCGVALIVSTVTTAHAQGEALSYGCVTGTTYQAPDGSERVDWVRNPDCKDEPKDEALQAYVEGATADIVSTGLALTLRDTLVEGNPLGVVGSIAVKMLVGVALAEAGPSPDRDLFARRVGAAQWGFAASNLCMILLPVQPLCAVIGLSVFLEKP